VPYTRTQASDDQNRLAVSERWEWDGQELGLLLKRAFSQQRPLLAVTAAGCLPYWSGFPSLDMIGLNDHHIARRRPPNMGRGLIGHEMGDGAYVLDRRPDIIVFGIGIRPVFRTGEELSRMPQFHEWYAPVRVSASFLADGALVYFDRHSSRVGVRETEGTVTVPGFFLTGEATIAVLDEHNQLGAAIPAGATAGVSVAVKDPGTLFVDSVRTAYGPQPEASVTHYERGVRVQVKASADTQVVEVVLRRR
jgi:arabinofuranosyltransferase